MTEEEGKTSTFSDYLNVVNPIGIQYNNPQLRYNTTTDFEEHLDTESPEFNAYFDKADIETKREMLKATSVSHAIKIFDRREEFRKSADLVSKDPLYTQIGAGLAASIADPTLLIPFFGVAGKTFGIAKSASRLNSIARMGAAGATAGVLGNVASESVFDAQGVQTDYMSAIAAGAIFGGTLGALGGALSGAYAGKVAHSVSKEADTFARDFENDPHIQLEVKDGVPNITGIAFPKMEKTFIDYTPFLKEWLVGDVNKGFMSESSAIREWMSKIANPTTALKDSKGTFVPLNKTMQDYKREFKGISNNLNVNFRNAFDMARNEGFKGSFSDFKKAVDDLYIKAAMEQERLAYASELKNKDYYNSNPVEFTHSNKGIAEGAKAYKDYFHTMLVKGKELKIKGLGDVAEGKLYRPRVYNFKEIKKKYTPDTLLPLIREALAAHPNQAKLTSAELDKAAAEVTDSLFNTSFNLNHLTTSFVPKTISPEGRLKGKKLKLNDSVLEKYGLVKGELDDLSGAYHYNMSGRFAVASKLGDDDVEAFMEALNKEMINRGETASGEDIQYISRIIDDILGNLRMNTLSDTPGWSLTRNLTTFNSLRAGGGFGGNQFLELATSMMLNGVSHIVTSGRFLNSFKNAGKLLYTKNKVDDDFTMMLVNSGHLEEVLHNHRINRFSDAEQGFNSGVLENKLIGMNDALMKFNGMRYFLGVMEDMTGGAIMVQLSKFGKLSKLSKTDEARLARWGLSHKDAKSLSNDLDKYYSPKEGRLELDKFSEKNRDNFQLAVSRGLEEVVVQGDSLHLPNWMKAPSPILKLFTQFMRFPLIANEVLLRRGLTQDKARLVAGAIASTIAYLGLKYVREQAAIQAGFVDEVDAKYDYYGFNGEENLERALYESLNYNAPLGMFSSIYNYGQVGIGNPELGRDYANSSKLESLLGITFGGLLPDTLDILEAGAKGDITDERTMMKLKSLVPYNNVPIVNEGLKQLIKEEF